MAELVGSALLSGFLNVLFDRMATQEVLNFFRGKKVLAKLLDELKIRLLSANKLMNDAELKQLTDENVKKWLDELKQVLYEADHVMDKVNTEALRGRIEESDQSGSKASSFFNFMPKLYSAFEIRVKSEVEEILRRLHLLLRQKEELGLREGVHQNRPQRLTAPLVDACDVYGRDAEKEAIIEMLLSDRNGGRKISVIPIVGMGGLGKTTLAQLVYNDSRVQDHFVLKVWATVSEDFDVFKLNKIMIEAITSQKCDIQDLYQLQNALKTQLMGKRFLFVHDDVWNENYELWDALKSPFNSGADGSKIIVTTRSEIVASRMGTVPAFSLPMISEDDCWNLFANHVFENKGSQIHPDLQEMGKEIVKKCKGLPLAIKSIAGCFPSLETIVISRCEEMVSIFPISQVEIDSAYPSLEFIELQDCPRLESFSGMGLPSNLKRLSIQACPMLIANRMNWDLQRLSSLQTLALRGCQFEEAADSFPEEGLLPSTLTSLEISYSRNIKALNGKGLQQLISLQHLEIYYFEELESLPEEGLPLSLTYLTIRECPLLKERCQRGTGEDWRKIQHIPNIRINSEKV